MTKEAAKALLSKYYHGHCTADEVSAIEAWMDSIGESEVYSLSREEQAAYLALIRANVHKHTGIAVGQYKKKRTFLRIAAGTHRWWAAAIVVLALGAGFFYVWQGRPHKSVVVKTAFNDKAPGGNHAYLTLSDGRRITLDSAQAGLLAIQGSNKVIMQANGRIAYDPAVNASAPQADHYNTLTTPRGGQFNITLSDGTKVRLNAGSSMRYPVPFRGKERLVSISGEAYFEVAHNAAMPFRVQAGNAMIEDVGTVFNVNAYTDEAAVKTTLLEGAVKVKGRLLKPGQQAAVSNATGTMTVNEVNVNAVVAWVKGLISADDISVEELMKQLSRWYDVDIRYEHGIPQERVGGLIDRNVNLSNILSVLQANGIHARLEGKTIIVSE